MLLRRYCSTSVTAARHVLITGAGRGIGEATALQFYQHGWQVTVVDKEFPTDVLPKGVEKICYDLTDLSGIPELSASMGEVHTVVNNAGVLHCPPTDGLPNGTLNYTEDQVMEILTVNLRAPVALAEAFSPQMITRASNTGSVGGRIVNVASVSAFTGHPDLWYGASKAAIANATKSLASQLGQHRVLVNCVAPGLTRTRMFDALPQTRKDAMAQLSYAGRAATVDEIAATICWLGSDSPEYVNGTILDVNNGFYPR
jgi:3-oxoacyl-[acyl-carrier protein] reductase